MSSSRRQCNFLIVSFLLMIFSAATVQIASDLFSGHRPRILMVFADKPTPENLRAYEDDLEDHSPVAQALRTRAQFVQFAVFDDLGDKALAGRDGWFFYKPGLAYLTQRPPAPQSVVIPPAGAVEDVGKMPAPKITNVGAFRAIRNFRDQLAQRGISLIVVPVPNKESIYPDILLGSPGKYAFDSPQQASPARQLIIRLESADVDVIDLFDLFAKARAGNASTGQPLYMAQDSHWGPSGLTLAASVVAAHVFQDSGISLGRIAYQEKPIAITRQGDILQMLRNPLIASAIPPENIRCLQVIDAGTGEPYRDETKSRVLVLGDSFLSVFEHDEPGSAGFVAHLAMELHQPVTSIVNDGGGATLVREELYRNPQMLAGKKVVVWEFVERDITLAEEGWKNIPLPATQ